MAASPLEKFFNSNDTLARLQDHARRLHRLQTVVDRCLPPNLRGLIAVANCKDAALTLHVPSPALATRVNMSAETIKADLLAMGELVESIQTKVRTTHAPPPPKPVPPRQIGSDGKAALESLRASLKPDDPLANALKRVLDRSR